MSKKQQRIVEELVQTHPEITAENAKSYVPRFPLSRVKKIAKMDEECGVLSNAVTVTTAFAAELFVQSLVESALAMSTLSQGRDSSKKTRSARLTYNDLAEVARKQEPYVFLEDALPKIQPNASASKNVSNKEKDQENEAEDDEEEPGNTTAEIEEQNKKNKQNTLSFFRYQANKPKTASKPSNEGSNADEDVDMDADEQEIDAEEDADEMNEQIQEQLSQVEQMDRVVDVDEEERSASQKERMILNRNQEDNNDMLASSDSDPEEGNISDDDSHSDTSIV